MDLNLSGRVALVAGGSKGIGRGVAMALAREGVDVALGARGAEELEKTAEEIRVATGRRCLPVQTDLSTLEGCRRFVQTAVEQFGQADILVYSANEPAEGGGTLFTIADEEWVHHINLKLLGAVRCSREVVPHMQRNGWGRIVFISGMATRVVRPTRMDNGPVCAALANFGRQLAAQVIEYGIRVNTVHPDATETTRFASRLAREAGARGISLEEMRREQERKLPLGRLLRPEETANLVVFLCSDLADAITGQSVAVDGGAAMSVHY